MASEPKQPFNEDNPHDRLLELSKRDTAVYMAFSYRKMRPDMPYEEILERLALQLAHEKKTAYEQMEQLSSLSLNPPVLAISPDVMREIRMKPKSKFEVPREKLPLRDRIVLAWRELLGR